MVQSSENGSERSWPWTFDFPSLLTLVVHAGWCWDNLLKHVSIWPARNAKSCGWHLLTYCGWIMAWRSQVVYHQPYLSTKVIAVSVDGKKSKDIWLGVNFRGGMERSENNLFPRKGGFAAKLEISWWRKCCRTWEEGKDGRAICVQHLGRRWIKVWFSAKCESWSREDEDCRASDNGAM